MGLTESATPVSMLWTQITLVALPADTPMWRSNDDEAWKGWKSEPLPMRRLCQPVEIAWAYVYLASDEASYCTGQTNSPNGGDVMW